MAQESIITAILDLGGINPNKIKKAGTYTEWHELPGAIRSRIFRHSSTQGPDEIAAQLEAWGIRSENDLLAYLKDPCKINIESNQASSFDQLLVMLEDTRRERDKLKEIMDEEVNFELSDIPDEELPKFGLGCWIFSSGQRAWLVGNTYPIKDKIKSIGGLWDPDLKAWWFPKEKWEKIEALCERRSA